MIPSTVTPTRVPMRPLRREVPRLDDDYSTEAMRQRMAFLADAAGAAPEHVGRYSFDPAVLAGNIENFIGVAQVPIGVAGPLLIDGEHARGTFYVPLATTEGALVASYNRGMKLVYAAGGVRTTVLADVMQRAPAFGFDSAREARAFGDWVTASFAEIKAEADATTQAAFRTRQPLVQTVTTNVLGPRAPLYVLGRRLTALHPYVPIGSAVRLSVAILSYVDTVSFGVTADAACAADLGVFIEGIQRGLAELSERPAS